LIFKGLELGEKLLIIEEGNNFSFETLGINKLAARRNKIILPQKMRVIWVKRL